MPTVRVNWEMNVGHLLSMATFLFAGASIYSGFQTKVSVLENRLATVVSEVVKIEATIDRLTTIIAADARQDEKILAIMVRLERIERMIEMRTGTANAGP